MPCVCPSCQAPLEVMRLACDACGTAVEGRFPVAVLARLTPEDQELVVHFVKASGSLKRLAHDYGVSYPTVRNRLDALIESLEQIETQGAARESGEE